MKNLFICLMLLMHLNTAMFICGAEMDQFDLNGQQLDDINSVVEFLDQVVLDHKDADPEDEDCDGGEFAFEIIINHLYYIHSLSLIINPVFEGVSRQTPFHLNDTMASETLLDVLTRPPDRMRIDCQVARQYLS